MQLQLFVMRRIRRVDWLPGHYTVGSGQGDDLRVEGLRAAHLRVTVELCEVIVVARGPAWVRGARLAPGERLLLLPGETIALHRRGRVRLVHPDAAPTTPLGTRSLLRRLLADGEVPTGIGLPRFVCVAGPDLGRALLVGGAVLELGRGPACGLRLADRAVSRRHARLVLDGMTVRLEDLESCNGTRVNGRRLHRARPLATGDLVGVGRTLLRYAAIPTEVRTRAEPAPPAPPAAPPAAGDGRRSW